MTNDTLYTPQFSSSEFRSLANHYRIRGKRVDVNYAYIRKNACTAFKRLINDKTHPRYFLSRLVGRNIYGHFHIKGNMAYHQAKLEDGQDATGALNLFVYRNPLDRFISVYLNKFVRREYASDILSNYRTITGLDPDAATIFDFLAYAEFEMKDLDCHMYPQKAHLYEIEYLAVEMGNLRDSMLKVLRKDMVDRFFVARVNSTDSDTSSYARFLGDHCARDLMELRSQGVNFGKSNLVSGELERVVREIYWQDYEMLDELGSKEA
ncbi:sulfotransferase family 2 domain-containing protein [Ruegeria sp. SCP11]|uniref:sulfotransferase family 2 domain-containing protein n=1 Tax=Ruegeria sp. SCP11 TaxID=3141378 RepID=UPI003337C169